ncbi:hypothetical protein MTR_2g461730 [Medicago truncatula]|uniref:Uncharacterized protein n=1 Tax=Medicago truncatula TaxID=3880 RepID=A0A072V7T6_MEDTR|nr:hypothetical protein MTR_2g461730 [Medicago truncatula]
MQKVGPQLSFPASVLGKARIFSTNPGRNSHYKYRPSSFRISRSELEQIKRKETLELRRVSIFSLIFLAKDSIEIVDPRRRYPVARTH